jgi:dihydrodipicolinate synthase/N-acetylneuraminate lyase
MRANAAGLDRREFLGALSMGLACLAIPELTGAQSTRKALTGVFPIGFTPINPAGKVDFDALAAQVQFCRRGGVHGFAWPQIASGWMTLTEAERRTGAEALVSAGKGGPTAVVIGVQSNTGDFAETERYARHAEKLGADAIICIPPPNVADAAQLLSFYQRLGKVTHLPMFVQTGGDFSVDLLVEMFNSIPTFRHVKDEAGNPLQRVTEITRRTKGKLQCFAGLGVMTMITEMEKGFAGHCPFTSLADVYASTYDLYHENRHVEAFDKFGHILAASSMFPQSSINVLIARGVLKPGTTARTAPPPPGAHPAPAPPSPDEIKRVLDTYLKADLRT